MADSQTHGAMPTTVEEGIEMARAQEAAGDPSATIDRELLEEVRDGKITPEQANVERVKRFEALRVQASAPRSYPDAITSPVDPPTVTGTDVGEQV
jgi:hypothetical protein